MSNESEITCITCDEDMNDLIAQGKIWCCECCGLLVGTEGKHDGCGFNLNGLIMCNFCYTGQCDCKASE